MDITNFIQTGGFPVKAERLQELQTAYSIFNQLGYVAGNLTIISGCVVTGSNVSDGFVFINGEVFPFKGSFLGTNVIIIQETASKEFKNGDVKVVHYKRYATFGTSETMWAWSSFKRVDPITNLMLRLDSLEKKTAVFTAGGGMVLWNKPANEIPTGWQEVVDWKGRIPVGMDAAQTEFNTLGKIGGAKSKTLSIAEMPEHDHSLFFKEYATGTTGNPGYDGGSNNYDTDVSKKTTKTGSGQEFSILNPYRTVLFIEFIG